MEEFIDYLVLHEPDIAPCEFGDHYNCSQHGMDNFRHYSYREYLEFHLKEFYKGA